MLDMVGVDSLVSAESECTSIVIDLFRHDFDMISTLLFSVRHDFDMISTQPRHVLNSMKLFWVAAVLALLCKWPTAAACPML